MCISFYGVCTSCAKGAQMGEIRRLEAAKGLLSFASLTPPIVKCLERNDSLHLLPYHHVTPPKVLFLTVEEVKQFTSSTAF